MSTLTVSLQHQEQEVAVGKLIFDPQGRTHLQLTQSFVDLQLSLSPFNIKPTTAVQTAPPHPFKGALMGLFGVFADSLPDGWGLLLMDRRLAQKGIRFNQITPLERLAYMGNRAMGALSYLPDTGDKDQLGQLLSLNQVALDAQEIYQGSDKEVSQQLHLVGGSPGGARPKAIIGLNGSEAMAGCNDLPPAFSHWLVKFPANKDEYYDGVIEYLYAQMAKDAGINFGPTRLIEAQNNAGFFAAKRFDRQTATDGSHHNKKVHMHTLAGLIDADFRMPDCDYEILLKATNMLTKNQQDGIEAFRRMVFNILCGNKDDHSKNFSYLMNDNGSWQLSPAYDITFNHGFNGHHSMSIAGFGQNIPLEAIQRVATQINLKPTQVKHIITQCADALSQWRHLAKAHDIPTDQSQDIGAYIDLQISALVQP